MLIRKVYDGELKEEEDVLAIEEPLQITLTYFQEKEIKQKKVSITMRTPGNDEELAAGFLFTEGIIQEPNEIEAIESNGFNEVNVRLKNNVQFDSTLLNRNFYTTSSCGVCGKSSIDAVKTNRSKNSTDNLAIDSTLLHKLPELVKLRQEVFRQTGGLHASTLISANGEISGIREDVGRHNALDKLIGHEFLNGRIPLNSSLLLLSGRASFELMQKAYMAGIPFVAAIGAPSTLAAEFAGEKDMTLVGFLRNNRFNIYHGEKRIRL